MVLGDGVFPSCLPFLPVEVRIGWAIENFHIVLRQSIVGRMWIDLDVCLVYPFRVFGKVEICGITSNVKKRSPHSERGTVTRNWVLEDDCLPPQVTRPSQTQARCRWIVGSALAIVMF